MDSGMDSLTAVAFRSARAPVLRPAYIYIYIYTHIPRGP